MSMSIGSVRRAAAAAAAAAIAADGSADSLKCLICARGDLASLAREESPAPDPKPMVEYAIGVGTLSELSLDVADGLRPVMSAELLRFPTKAVLFGPFIPPYPPPSPLVGLASVCSETCAVSARHGK